MHVELGFYTFINVKKGVVRKVGKGSWEMQSMNTTDVQGDNKVSLQLKKGMKRKM